jgi:hypothetical protein
VKQGTQNHFDPSNGQTLAPAKSHASDSVPSQASAWRWIRSRRGAITFLAVFAVVAWAKPMGLLLWARIRILTSLPKTAIADDPTTSSAAPEPETPIEFDSGLGATNEIRTDPFRIDPHTFPKPTPAAPVAAPITPQPKVEPSTADETRREALQAAGRQAERFRLQSAGKGLSMAVIDGRTYRVGDVLESTDGSRFTLVEVRDNAAFVEWEGERFELRLRTPAGAGSAAGNGGTRE